MEILVNGEVKKLSIIDLKSGCDWAQDLIGNADGFDGFDDEEEMYFMSQDNFDWWESYIHVEKKLQYAAKEIRDGLSGADQDKFDQKMIDSGNNDMEMMQQDQVEIVNQWEAKGF